MVMLFTLSVPTLSYHYSISALLVPVYLVGKEGVTALYTIPTLSNTFSLLSPGLSVVSPYVVMS